MDTEVTFDQRLALSSTSSGDAEEFSGHCNVDAAEQIQLALLVDHAKSSDATTDAQLLAEQFAGILYFATRAAGAESVRLGPDAPDHRQTRAFDRVLKGSRRPTNADERPWRPQRERATRPKP